MAGSDHIEKEWGYGISEYPMDAVVGLAGVAGVGVFALDQSMTIRGIRFPSSIRELSCVISHSGKIV